MGDFTARHQHCSSAMLAIALKLAGEGECRDVVLLAEEGFERHSSDQIALRGINYDAT